MIEPELMDLSAFGSPRLCGCGPVVVCSLKFQDAAQVRLIEHDYMVETFESD